ncbi:hypothetical protein TYRP_016342 [Tyrophagus putrescentiae]|nr:hypothetical protein TYRP_016342 [Tyrophagus putrescentiae]
MASSRRREPQIEWSDQVCVNTAFLAFLIRWPPRFAFDLPRLRRSWPQILLARQLEASSARREHQFGTAQ